MKIIGHRGARNEAPENTVPSFVHAQKNGCLHFELDVQLSSDNELVVFHDSNLKRTCGIRQQLKHLPFHVLKKTDARLNTPGWVSPCYIPSLQEVIDSVPDTLSWQFEVKKDTHHRMDILTCKLKEILIKNQLFDKAVITSNSKSFLKRFKISNPTITTGYVAEYAINRPVSSALKLKNKLLVLNEKLATVDRIENALGVGLEISCWTVNDVFRMEELFKLGVSSIITDQPTLAIKHLS